MVWSRLESRVPSVGLNVQGEQVVSHSVQASSRFLLAIVVVALCVGCDRATKQIATQSLGDKPPQWYQSFLADTVRIQYAQNPGAFLSLGRNLSPSFRFGVFVVFNALFLLAALYVLAAHWMMHPAKFVAVALLLAGGIGNLIDRVTNDGQVTDFLNLGLGPIRTGIFNVADVAISTGVVLLFVLWSREPDQPQAQ